MHIQFHPPEVNVNDSGMRALVVTNMYPTAERPALGSFVRDQVEALRRIPGVEVELFAFEPGSSLGYGRAGAELRRRGAERFDIVHAHFGLTAWPALAARARRRVVTLHGTDLVSESLAAEVPRWASRRAPAVLPAGVDVARFRRIDRAEARAALGLDPSGPYLLFPADPGRPEKRYDLARSVAGDVPLLSLGNVDPAAVPLWVNAANAVLIPSAREGFGLGVLEALACDVPVLATPVGIAPEVLSGLPGVLCERFDLERWRAAVEPHRAAPDPRIDGRARAQEFSTDRMAARVAAAWEALG
jgi:teichuronic acid biosynthesis glycosyltransferase TuaC